MIPDLKLPGWVVASLLILCPGVVVGMLTVRELGSLAAALGAGLGTCGGIASILSFLAAQRRR